jgi:xanthine dehydrogenase accessory factor
MYNPGPIFKFVEAKQALGQAVVLVTIAAASASSSRNPGAHLAVSEDGAMIGSLSGGCIETAIAAEALEVLRQGRPRMTRYGQGSRFLDIRLPCGGSLDLVFSPLSDPQMGAALVERLARRVPFRISLSLHNATADLSAGDIRFGAQLTATHLAINHIPPLRLLLIGQGAAVEVLHDIGATIGIESMVYSPNRDLVERIHLRGSLAFLLAAIRALPNFETDQSTAAALLLHEHEWEPPILKQLLPSKVFYLGAMGSSVVHSQRIDVLKEMGVSIAALERISAPIGLIPSMRDPETLAVSIIAQIIKRFNRDFLAF